MNIHFHNENATAKYLSVHITYIGSASATQYFVRRWPAQQRYTHSNFNTPVRKQYIFSSATRSVAHPLPIQQIREALSQGQSGQKREGSHSPPFITHVKNIWRYAYTPPCIFMAWHFGKENFTFTLSRTGESIVCTHITMASSTSKNNYQTRHIGLYTNEVQRSVLE